MFKPILLSLLFIIIVYLPLGVFFHEQCHVRNFKECGIDSKVVYLSKESYKEPLLFTSNNRGIIIASTISLNPVNSSERECVKTVEINNNHCGDNTGLFNAVGYGFKDAVIRGFNNE